MEVRESQSKRAKLMIESSPLEDLNEDLLIEILCRLPYKCVVQCKCVSKNWFSLINSTQFVARFSSLNNLPWTFIYPRYWKMEEEDFPKLTSNNPVFESPGFSLRFLPFCRPGFRIPETFEILKTYNDLILCKNYYLEDAYYLCNPLTMQWVSLPPTPHPEFVAYVDFICELKEDDQKKHHKYMFKVVRVPAGYVTTQIKMGFFSSEIGQWIEISTSVPLSDGFEIEDAVIGNEKLILLGRMEESTDFEDVVTNIIIIIDDVFNGEVCSVHHYHTFNISRDSFPCYEFYGLCRVPKAGLRLARLYMLESHPLIKIWEFDYNNYDCRLLQEVYLKDLSSENEWVSKIYLRNIFKTQTGMEDSDEEMEEKFVPIPSVLGFDPCDVNILYLHLHCGGRMGKYNIRRKSLNIVQHTQLGSLRGGEAFPLVLRLPTPVSRVKRE